mgnify:CR=1 FL=1
MFDEQVAVGVVDIEVETLRDAVRAEYDVVARTPAKDFTSILAVP